MWGLGGNPSYSQAAHFFISKQKCLKFLGSEKKLIALGAVECCGSPRSLKTKMRTSFKWLEDSACLILEMKFAPETFFIQVIQVDIFADKDNL